MECEPLTPSLWSANEIYTIDCVKSYSLVLYIVMTEIDNSH